MRAVAARRLERGAAREPEREVRRYAREPELEVRGSVAWASASGSIVNGGITSRLQKTR